MHEEIKISIIIATRNREKILWETVGIAVKVIENTDAELILVNDGDTSLIIPEEFLGKIAYFNNPKRGVSSARNFGALNAKGDILFFIDDDMWINSEVIKWINTYIIEKSNTASVYFINWKYPSCLDDNLKGSKVGRYILDINYNNLWGRLEKKTEEPLSGLYQYNNIGSGSLVVPKIIFSNVGRYNEIMVFAGEDNDLAGKINKLEIPIYIVFDVILYHNHADRLEIHNFLKRIYDGFGSEFKAAAAGITTPLSNINYKGFRYLIFDFFRATENGWILLHKVLPNLAFIQPIQNRLLGILGGLQRYKQWRNIISNKI